RRPVLSSPRSATVPRRCVAAVPRRSAVAVRGVRAAPNAVRATEAATRVAADAEALTRSRRLPVSALPVANRSSHRWPANARPPGRTGAGTGPGKRRGRNPNPRYLRVHGFRDQHDRPLCHLSGVYFQAVSVPTGTSTTAGFTPPLTPVRLLASKVTPARVVTA